MAWEAKVRMGLPVYKEDLAVDTIYKNPGDTITVAEMEAAKQGKDDIKALVAADAIEEK